jgi:hypothetical protein
MHRPNLTSCHGHKLLACLADKKLLTYCLLTAAPAFVLLEAIAPVKVASAVSAEDCVVALVWAVLSIAGFAGCNASVVLSDRVRLHAGKAEECLVGPSLEKAESNKSKQFERNKAWTITNRNRGEDVEMIVVVENHNPLLTFFSSEDYAV